jgi:hypothetical protein
MTAHHSATIRPARRGGLGLGGLGLGGLGPRLSIAAAGLCLLCSVTAPAAAQTVPLSAKFKAVTGNMTPSGVALEVEILKWSDHDERTAAVAALASNQPGSKLAEIPTKGYLWAAGSSVGYSIKYAHRAMGADGHDLVTLVTNRALGSYTFDPWKIGDEQISKDVKYSVVELDLTNGVGYIATPSGIVLDDKEAVVTLKTDPSRQPVLTKVQTESAPETASGEADRSAGGG